MNQKIEIKILNVIRDHNSGDPVSFVTIDHVLLLEHTDYIRSGQLGGTLRDLEKKELIYVASEKGGYGLTDKGRAFLTAAELR